MVEREVEAFLTLLATRGNVAAGTQNQALSALLFLYREVLKTELPWMESVVRAKRPRRIPAVLSREEVTRLLAAMEGQGWLMAAAASPPRAQRSEEHTAELQSLTRKSY